MKTRKKDKRKKERERKKSCFQRRSSKFERYPLEVNISLNIKSDTRYKMKDARNLTA